MNSTTDESEPFDFYQQENSVFKELLEKDKEDSTELFKDRACSIYTCEHGLPQMEAGLMRCPLCGEIAEECKRDDGTYYLGYP